MVLIGACAAAVLSIKVNIGGLAFISIACACAFTVPVLRRHTAIPILVSAIFVATPFLLLSGRLDHSDVLNLAALTALSGLALCWILARTPTEKSIDGWDVYLLAIGALVVLVFVITVPFAGGTTPGALIDGVVLKPASTPGLQFAPPVIGSSSLLWATAAMLGAIAWRRWLNAGSLGPWAEVAIGLGRLVAGLLIWFALTGVVGEAPMTIQSGLVIGAPLAWLAAIAPGTRPPETTFVRALIPALAISRSFTPTRYPSLGGASSSWSWLAVSVSVTGSGSCRLQQHCPSSI